MSSDLVKRLRELAAGKHDDKEFALDAAEHIEALEGEVARLSKAHDERLKQNTLERAATHKQFHRAEAAEARAERLEGEVERLASALEGADQDVQERLLKAEARAEIAEECHQHALTMAKKEMARAERLYDLLCQLFEEATTCDGWVRHTDVYETVRKEVDKDGR